MPSVTKSFIMGMKRIAAMPSEERATPSSGSFLNTLGQNDAAIQARGINRGTQRTAENQNLENEKRDIQAARNDVNVSLPLNIANTGIQGLTAWDKMVMAKHQELLDKANEDKLDSYYQTINAYPEKFKAVLNGEAVQ